MLAVKEHGLSGLIPDKLFFDFLEEFVVWFLSRFLFACLFVCFPSFLPDHRALYYMNYLSRQNLISGNTHIDRNTDLFSFTDFTFSIGTSTKQSTFELIKLA